MAPRARVVRGPVRWRWHGVLALLTLSVFLPQLGRGLMLYDLGELLLYSQALRDGRAPGLDFVVNGYGPGRYLLHAGLVTLTSASPLAVAFALFLLCRLALAALTLELALRLLPVRWVPLPLLLITVAPGPLHKGFFMAGSVALALAAVGLAERAEPRRAWLFGAVLATVACFRLDLGLFGAVVLTGLCWRRPRLWLAGAALPMGLLLAMAGSLLALGALAPVLSQVSHDVLVNQRVPYPTWPGLGELVSGEGSLPRALLWTPVVVYGALLLRWRELDRREWTLLLLGALCANQARMKPELGHLLQAGPLLWVALALLASRLRAGAVAWAMPLLLAAVALGSERGSVYTGSFTIPWGRDRLLPSPAGALVLSPEEQAFITPVLDWLAAQPEGEGLWVPANQPLLHALSGRHDRVGTVGLLYVADAPARQAELLARLDAERPALAVFLDDSLEGPTRRLEVAAPAVFAYLDSHYPEVHRVGPWSMRRRASP